MWKIQTNNLCTASHSQKRTTSTPRCGKIHCVSQCIKIMNFEVPGTPSKTIQIMSSTVASLRWMSQLVPTLHYCFLSSRFWWFACSQRTYPQIGAVEVNLCCGTDVPYLLESRVKGCLPDELGDFEVAIRSMVFGIFTMYIPVVHRRNGQYMMFYPFLPVRVKPIDCMTSALSTYHTHQEQ